MGTDPEQDPQITDDELLHPAPAADPTPEDLVLATGRDLTPENLEWARQRLAEEGPAAMEKRLP